MNARADLCIGRYRFVIADGLVIIGRQQSIYRVDVQTVSAGKNGVQAVWQAKLANVERIAPVRGNASSVLRRFDLKPGVRAVWYTDMPDEPLSHRLLAMRVVADHAVIAERGSSPTGHATIEELIGDVLDYYVPSTEMGFCVGSGAVTSEPGRNEHTAITFEDSQNPKLQIEFMTETVRDPDTSGYLNANEEEAAAAATGAKLSILRNRMRTAGGVEGHELWIGTDSPDEGAFVRFTWEFAGMAENAIQPYIQLRGFAPLSEKGKLERIWETMMASLRPVPAPPEEP